MYDNINKKLENSINKNIIDIVESDTIPTVIDLIMDDYDFYLNDVSNPKSKLAPERYMDEFKERLEQFEYIVEDTKVIKIVLPDIENFDFKDGLEPIQNILEGIIGIYVEVERSDYIQATKKYTYRGKYLEVYLIRYTGEVRKWEKTLDKKFEKYPFSNTPPVDVFGRACEYVDGNLNTWIDTAINESKREVRI